MLFLAGLFYFIPSRNTIDPVRKKNGINHLRIVASSYINNSVFFSPSFFPPSLLYFHFISLSFLCYSHAVVDAWKWELSMATRAIVSCLDSLIWRKGLGIAVVDLLLFWETKSTASAVVWTASCLNVKKAKSTFEHAALPRGIQHRSGLLLHSFCDE